jgi:ribosomal protein L9
MPRGRSTFTKRQKEHTRQQRQRDKAERRNQRKQEKAVAGSLDKMAELREHAAEQVALFNLGVEGADTVDTAEQSTPGDHVSQ